jgi:hypothetical protein
MAVLPRDLFGEKQVHNRGVVFMVWKSLTATAVTMAVLGFMTVETPSFAGGCNWKNCKSTHDKGFSLFVKVDVPRKFGAFFAKGTFEGEATGATAGQGGTPSSASMSASGTVAGIAARGGEAEASAGGGGSAFGEGAGNNGQSFVEGGAGARGEAGPD